ncbi:MAG: tRNA glutamyl-Q(34) synthetase GluQRS [Betaproteobacteria bacterium]|nr:tRNA glutamyl-Q(34) synthetase GluQRS [Betaproteobacteria bacterium]
MPATPPASTLYRGRFAPSPTGPLHFGSLVAAVGSHADARASGGVWLVRMEDLDPLRESPGASDAILRALEAFGMEWDGPCLYQSTRMEAYREALDRLASAALTYPCGCTRKEIADSALRFESAPAREVVYPGTCRNGLPPGRAPRSVRLRVGEAQIEFDDAVQGHCRQQLGREVGDFVVRRADGHFAYQLAVVVDDADQGITDIVRGADLLASTARQIFLQRCLGVPTPRYCHLPVATDATGEKLSKQTRAAPVDPDHPGGTLAHALTFVGHAPPAGMDRAGTGALWEWAIANWDRARIPRARAVPVPD